MKYQYHVVYRRDGEPTNRHFHRSVVAASADDARSVVAQLDPKYLSTVKSPRRGAEVKA